jgi:hypothetical protein
MKNRPGIATGFGILGALSLVLILALASFGGALNQTSDGAYAPMNKGLSGKTEACFFIAYYIAGCIAAFTSKREGRILWMVAAHVSLFIIFFSEAISTHDKGSIIGFMMILGFFILCIPTFLWFSLLKQNENGA